MPLPRLGAFVCNRQLLLAALFVVSLAATTDAHAQGTTPTLSVVPVPPVAPALPVATLHVSEVRQPIYGFGGTQTYSGDALADFPGREAVYRALFQELNLDILRLRNYYDYDKSEPRFEQITHEFASAAIRFSDPSKRNGKAPVRLLFTSWSPPAALKSNQLVSGHADGTEKGLGNATLKRGADGSYAYGEFADWWLASLNEFKSLCGVYPDYITLQNELDFAPNYEGCRFLPAEGVEPQTGFALAGYDRALMAVSDRLKTSLGAQAPKILGPETFTIRMEKDGNHLAPWADPIQPTGKAVLDRVFGVSYHLYGVGAESPDPARFHAALDSVQQTYHDGKPLFETEFLEGDTLTHLASMINDTLTQGDTSAYLVWILARSAQTPGYALVYFHPEDGSIERRERFYAVKAFSAFVGEGWSRIDAASGDPDVKLSAYIGPKGKELVAVLINPTDAEHRIVVSPDGAAFQNATSVLFRSSEGESGERWRVLGALPASNVVVLPKRSVATVKFTRAGL